MSNALMSRQWPLHIVTVLPACVVWASTALQSSSRPPASTISALMASLLASCRSSEHADRTSVALPKPNVNTCNKFLSGEPGLVNAVLGIAQTACRRRAGTYVYKLPDTTSGNVTNVTQQLQLYEAVPVTKSIIGADK